MLAVIFAFLVLTIILLALDESVVLKIHRGVRRTFKSLAAKIKD